MKTQLIIAGLVGALICPATIWYGSRAWFFTWSLDVPEAYIPAAITGAFLVITMRYVEIRFFSNSTDKKSSSEP